VKSVERLEALIWLRHSNWDIAEVAYALAFKEPTHFSNFFKKNTGLSPSGFRRLEGG
jgi:AraC-like DNA-binding protein